MNDKPKYDPPRAAVIAQRQQFAQRLMMAEHDLIEAQLEVEKKSRDAEQLRGAVQACDLILGLPPPAAPP